MSDINKSLIGFLQKKSLFAQSPEKNSRRRSRSKEKLEFSSKSMRQQTLLETAKTKDKQEGSPFAQLLFKAEDSANEKKQKEKRDEENIKKQKVHRNFNFKKEEPKEVKEKQQQKQAKTVSSTNTQSNFQSARIQSSQCLEGLSGKIRNEISTINYKFDRFQTEMKGLLEKELKSIHQTISELINKIFQQNYRNIKNYIKRQEEALGRQLFLMKEQLEAEYEKVQQMKEEINKPNWRKVAGELLSSDIQSRIQATIARSHQIEIKEPDIFNYDEHSLKQFEQSLRNLMRYSQNQIR